MSCVVQVKRITVKQGKVDFKVNVDTNPYSTYKIMIGDSLSNLKPLVKVE